METAKLAASYRVPALPFRLPTTNSKTELSLQESLPARGHSCKPVWSRKPSHLCSMMTVRKDDYFKQIEHVHRSLHEYDTKNAN
jgi:hypothetical protein